jgi:pimeloyl-ACP methyl ester carboxylesterase
VRQDVEFSNAGVKCAAWYYPAAGRCCIVMAHGLGGIRESRLAPYAERFAAAGFPVLVFDYRHFGDSQGEPRQLGSIPRQLEDWRAAVGWALRQQGTEKVALWGTSFSGGHVVVTAAGNPDVAAVIAQNPMLDGRAAFLQAAVRVGPWMVLRTTMLALQDVVQGLLGRPPVLIPVAAVPGQVGFLSAPDSLPGYLALSPPFARNELSARLALHTASYRPIRWAQKVNCPVLLQICQQDTVAPTSAALATASILGACAKVVVYPIGHFDIYFGDHFERAVTEQIDFLRTFSSF